METHTIASALGSAFAIFDGSRPRGRSGAPHRSGAPVLRGSIEAGTFEESFWMKPAKGEPDRILDGARRYVAQARKQGAEIRRGAEIAGNRLLPLSGAAIDVLEYLCMMARTCGGKLFPSYDAIMEATARCRATVAKALAQLESLHIIARRRRFVRIERKGPGPRSEQTSNAYRLQLPNCIARLLPASKRPAPVPEDHAHHIEQTQAEYFAMRKSRSSRPIVSDDLVADFMERNPEISDPALAAVLARLEKKGLEGGFTDCQSESSFQTQPLPYSYSLIGRKDAT